MSQKGPLKGRAARLGRFMPSGPSTAARTPFVLLVVLLLGGGLITLLLLNSALNQGSFELSELKKKTTELTDEEQALQRDVDDHSAPDALERRARQLGMVPGGSPAFLGPDGSVLGVPTPAAWPEPSPTPPPVPTPTVTPGGTPAGSPQPPAATPGATAAGTSAAGTSAPGTSAGPGATAGSALPGTPTAPTTPGR
ncbi:septum formation initiator [Streptomyces roseoviridis]|uniref:Septum formation initiator family protein n=1 Tax=Streptomyces roseoviridis TaxID=67361 RepID=A0ABV5QML7_9ACTN